MAGGVNAGHFMGFEVAAMSCYLVAYVMLGLFFPLLACSRSLQFFNLLLQNFSGLDNYDCQLFCGGRLDAVHAWWLA